MDRAAGFYPIGRGFKSSWGHHAVVAQLAERLPRKEDVAGSSPTFGSSFPYLHSRWGFCDSGGELLTSAVVLHGSSVVPPD